MNSYPNPKPFTSVSEMLTETLRCAILSGELKGGQSLRQQRLARQYRVSEVMVREAFRRLEAAGLVEGEPRRGVHVCRHSVEEIAELYELRVLLEELITRHAVPRCTRKDLADAEAILRRMDGELDPVLWLALNREFHDVLYQPSNRKRLLKFAGQLRVSLERYLRLSLGILKGFAIAQCEHRAILAAYRAKQSRLAVKRVGAHLRRTAEFIGQFLKERERVEKPQDGQRGFARADSGTSRRRKNEARIDKVVSVQKARPRGSGRSHR